MDSDIAKIKHKPIKCPHCGRRLIDEDANTCTKIITNPGNEQYADYYIKCMKCAAEVGIIKIK